MTGVPEEVTGMPFFMVDWAVKDLNKIVYRVTKSEKRKDAVMIYSGKEGSGKSTIVSQHAYYVAKKCGTSFGLDNYYFTPEHLYNAVMTEKYPSGTVFIYDEAVTGLMGSMSSSATGRKLHRMFSTCRNKRYAIFICIPRFYELAYWMAIDRSIAMYECFEDELDEYGDGINKYKGFNEASKQYYWMMKKMKKWKEALQAATTRPEPFPAWPFGKKSKSAPFTIDEYEKRKNEILAKQEKTNFDKVKEQRDKLIVYLNKEKNLSSNQIERICGLNDRMVRDVVYESSLGGAPF